jgi:hypothetical protein
MAQDTSHTGTPSTTRQGNGLAVAGLVCGLVGLIFFNVVLGPLAIIFGGIAWSRANHGAPHRGMAITSVVLGIVDLVIWGILVAVVANHGGFMSFQLG